MRGRSGAFTLDLKGKDVAQRSFLGIAFHVVDWTTLEDILAEASDYWRERHKEHQPPRYEPRPSPHAKP